MLKEGPAREGRTRKLLVVFVLFIVVESVGWELQYCVIVL